MVMLPAETIEMQAAEARDRLADAREQRRKWQEASAKDRAENERLRSVLHTIGAMVYMDRHGNIRFKPDYSPEDMLNAVNAALEK